MKCPVCDIEMEPGEIRIKASAAGFLIIGFSYKHLWFYPSHSDATPGKVDHLARRMVLSNSEKTEAHNCEACGATLVLRGSSD